MKHIIINILALLIFAIAGIQAQPALTARIDDNTTSTTPDGDESIQKKNDQLVLVTGVRFAYPLVQQWIDEFNKEFPDVQRDR